MSLWRIDRVMVARVRTVQSQLLIGMLAVGALSVCTPVSAQSITALGSLPGMPNSTARAVTPDGNTVVGGVNAGSTFTGFGRAVRWTRSGGLQSLGTLGGDHSLATDVSDDGSTVVGFSSLAGSTATWAFRHTAGAGMVNLGSATGQAGSSAWGVSADGSVIAGRSRTPTSSGLDRAVRREGEGGWVDLGVLGSGRTSLATGISGDGRVIVGQSATLSNFAVPSNQAFRHVQGLGMSGLGTAGFTQSAAHAASYDGSVIVGRLSNNTSSGAFLNSAGFRWTASGGMQVLGPLRGQTTNEAFGLTPDGSTVVGGVGRATLWRADLGLVDLNSYLPTQGVDLSGWLLQNAMGISADGLVLVGNGTFRGVEQGWIVTLIPAPGASVVVLAAGIGSLVGRRRRSC